MFFLVLLSHFTTQAISHNHFPVPSSCTGDPSLLKCAFDIEAALKAAASNEIHIAASELNVVLDSINAAKITVVSIQHFLSSMHGDLINERPNLVWFSNLKSCNRHCSARTHQGIYGNLMHSNLIRNIVF
jgi:hypothetical protein